MAKLKVIIQTDDKVQVLDGYEIRKSDKKNIEEEIHQTLFNSEYIINTD